MLTRRGLGAAILTALLVACGNKGGTSRPTESPGNLGYAINPAVYTVGTAIAPNAPSSSGGAVAFYSVAPVLPSGLGLNTTTGVIGGTPTAVKATAGYTVTATNAAGSTTAVVGITVNPTATVPPSNLSYATSPAVYTVGTAIAPNAPSNSGDAVASYSVAPALPSGLGLNATTGVIGGTPTAVAATAGYTVTATNASGSTTAVLRITVVGPGTTATLQVQGRLLVDTCGNALVVRGVEQIFGVADRAGNGPFSLGGSYTALVDEIAMTGANAIRILPQSDLPANAVDAIIGQAASHQMVVYISNNGLSTDTTHTADQNWLAQPDIIAAINKYEKWTIVDAVQEYTGTNRTQWQTDAIARVRHVRSLGYTQPLKVMAPTSGRDLPSVLASGAAIAAADPLGRTILGWQAYWGNSGHYQSRFGMTLLQGVTEAAAAAFPIQIGILNWAEVGCTDALAYQSVMSAAQANQLGWMYWDYYLPGYTCFDMTTSGRAASLTRDGDIVVNANSGLRATSSKACGQ